MSAALRRTVIIDLDGTLVDSNYQHALAWYRAFREHDVILPIWQIHRRTGMGGDKLVADLVDPEVEQRIGDQVRDRHGELYSEMIGEVAAVEGATELLEELHERGHVLVLASSAQEDEVEHYLQLLDAREIVDAWTSSGDVEETKPAPDLVESALERVEASPDAATMLGDSTWDVKAAEEADVETIAVMTGGFSEAELREAGAIEVFESVARLREALDQLDAAG